MRYHTTIIVAVCSTADPKSRIGHAAQIDSNPEIEPLRAIHGQVRQLLQLAKNNKRLQATGVDSSSLLLPMMGYSRYYTIYSIELFYCLLYDYE